MKSKYFGYIYWGFFFIMLSFRIQGFDIFPDLVGYILFFLAFSGLKEYSSYFNKANICNIPMIFLSLFNLYQQRGTVLAGRINLGVYGIWSIPLAIATAALGILTVYYLLKGISEMALIRGRHDIVEKSEEQWKHYLFYQIAVILTFIVVFIPVLGLGYVIFLFALSIIIMFSLMRLMSFCKENLTT